jgi:hypothetical protein
MSPASELAARVLRNMAAKRVVPLHDQMRLRYLARRDEVTLPIEEIARRILQRDIGLPLKSKAAGQA